MATVYPSPTQQGPSTFAGQRQFLVQLSSDAQLLGKTGLSNDIPSFPAGSLKRYWANKTGGESQTAATKVYDAGNPYPFVVPGVYAVNDLTITRPWDISMDPGLCSVLRPYVGRWYVKIVITPTDADYSPLTPTETYHGLLTGVTPPTVDASSGTAATLALTFTIAWVG